MLFDDLYDDTLGDIVDTLSDDPLDECELAKSDAELVIEYLEAAAKKHRLYDIAMLVLAIIAAVSGTVAAIFAVWACYS